MPPTKFTVDRSLWYRGADDPMLLRPDGSMCCLGFLALACGLQAKHIQGTGLYTELNAELDELEEIAGMLPRRLVDFDGEEHVLSTKLTNKIIAMNDDDALPVEGSERELHLASLFREAGIEVEFVGEGCPASCRSEQGGRMTITRQEMFDRAWRGLRAQGFERSVLPDGKGCVYLSLDGTRRCAWGHVDPDGTHDQGSRSFSQLRERMVGLAAHVSPNDLVFCSELQACHDDSKTPADMRLALRELAQFYRLEMSE